MADENVTKVVENEENNEKKQETTEKEQEITQKEQEIAAQAVESEVIDGKGDEKGEKEPEWSPNLKVKVMDEEHDLPEWVKGAITKENESEVRDIFEKALGLPHLKTKNQDLLKSKEQVSAEFEEFKNCYLVGGGTHPGSGLPTIYESGRISAELIMKRDGIYK